ncbi:MAG: response regulator transcription factor [Chthoniobacteraceae bacterium]
MKATPISQAQTAATRVVVVDDHASLREMLVIILKMEGGYEVVGEASRGMEALKLCRAVRPALVILDLALPELSGSHLIRLLLHEPWPVRIVVYSGVVDEDLLREALAEGPHGFVRKEDSLPELRTALRAVASGSRHISHCSEHLLPKRDGSVFRTLTPQESAVVQMIAEGHQNKEMATALGVSDKTVEHHRQNVMKKLGLHDVAALTRYAIRHRMLLP